MPVSLEYSLLRTTADLEALVPEWRALWSAIPSAKPFQRPEWLLPWWKQFGQPDLHAVCMRRAGELVGLIALYVYAEPQSGERQLLLLGAGTSDYLDGLFLASCTPVEIRAALATVAEENTWDTLHLTQLPPESLLKAALDEVDAALVQRHPGEICSRCPAALIADLPRKVRSEIRYFRNAAIGRGKLRLEIADAASCTDFLNILVKLHAASWQVRGQAGVLAALDVLAWHAEAVPAMQAVGALRLYVLSLDAEPIAALYALIDPPSRPGRTEYFYLIGYSPEHAEFKPGALLTAMASEGARADGVETIDMLRGNEAYKKFWHVEEVPTFGYSVSCNTVSRIGFARP